MKVSTVINLRPFSGPVMTLLTGSGLSQLIMFAASPMLTRLYDPGAFGQYAILSFVLSFAIVIATGKFEIAVLLPKTDEEGWALVCLAGGITIIVTLVGAVVFSGVLLTVGASWVHGLGVRTDIALVSFIVLSSAVVFLSGWQCVLFVWMNRLGNYRGISAARIVQAFVMAFSQICLSFAIEGLFGLLTGTVIGLFFCLLVQIAFVIRSQKYQIPQLVIIKQVARDYSNFPLHTIPTDLASTLLAQFPIYFLGSRFSDEAVGYYSLAQRTLLAPMQLIASSVGDVFRKQASALYLQRGECSAYFRKVAIKLAAIAIAVGVAVVIFFPDLFAFVFGEKWRIAGEYSRILIVMYSLKFIVSPLSFMFIIAKRTRLDLGLHITFLVVLIGVFGAMSGFEISEPQAIALFVSVYSIMYVTYLILSIKFSKGNV
ncbi:MAG: hypothetical protein DVS81_07575 [Candidatus Accumulibacter meliphilus]|jgi:O-antigen/teichoic acid export membrane protein|uniref:O-antigen flippase Wzx n=1 Tax=Candidatus Accumulibacter meliphilus TaxID=2211374 RepID=A0A369XP39_9PROT|nr:MAG: hypothetical protein DVS81_07575 [Candidatus Accumulibacter meliphilus]